MVARSACPPTRPSRSWWIWTPARGSATSRGTHEPRASRSYRSRASYNNGRGEQKQDKKLALAPPEITKEKKEGTKA